MMMVAVAVVVFLGLGGARRMQERANISKLARLFRRLATVVVMAVIWILTFPHRGTECLLVHVGVVLDLLSGMRLVAILTARTPIEQATLELGRHVRRTKHLSS